MNGGGRGGERGEGLEQRNAVTDSLTVTSPEVLRLATNRPRVQV